MKTRRDWEHELRREFIARAANDLFRQHSFNATTMEDIARKAEFGKGTIYHYFQGKMDILRFLIEKRLEESGTELERIRQAENDPLVGLNEAISIYYHFFRENAHLFYAIVNETEPVGQELVRMMHESFRSNVRLLAVIMRRGMEAGIIFEADPSDLARALINVVRGFSLREFGLGKTDDGHNEDESLVLARRILFQGILMK